MATMALGGILSSRISSFMYTNGKELENSYVKIASGKNIQDPSDGAGDYLRSESYTVRNKEYGKVGRLVDESLSVINYAEQANTMIWDDLSEMEGLVNDYYRDGASTDEKYAIGLQFEELKKRIVQTQEGAVWDGKEVLSDSSADPLVSINTDPSDVSQRYEVSFDTDKIVDVTLLSLGVDEATDRDALEEQTGRAASYAAQLTGYRYGINAQRKIVDTSIDNNTRTYETIQNIDDAQELFDMTKKSVQQQAARSFFAQNSMHQGSVLALVAGM